MIEGTARQHITLLWPEHLAHLAPEPSRLGIGEIDEEDGVVCNCGEILGFPKVQDESEYLQQSSEPGDELTAVEAGWNDMVSEPEHQYDPDGTETLADMQNLAASVAGVDSMNTGERAIVRAEDSMQQDYEQDIAAKAREYGNAETHPDGSWRCRFDGQMATEHPIDYPGQFHCITPMPYPIQPADEAQTFASPGPPPAARAQLPERDSGVVMAEDPIAARVVVIDPTLPYGPQDVEHQLLDISGRIERGVHYQRYWEERQFEAKAAYTLSMARARTESDGRSVQAREDEAVLQCEEQYRELLLCDAMVRAVRETMHSLRSLQSGYQTVSRSVSESMRMPNTRP